MITKENGLRYAKLIHVSIDNGKTDNSNKVYIMEELSDGRIKCEYGRVGRSLTTEYKDSSKWSSVLKQKLSKAKNYTDVTELLAEPVTTPTSKNDKTIAIKDAMVKKLIEELMAYANKSIQRNYKVTQESVSEQQVNAAQEIIDSISKIIKIKVDTKEINSFLLKLYTIIPRRMDNVRHHLFEDIVDSKSLTKAKELLTEEQNTLDTMGGQVKLLKQQKAKLDTVDTNTSTENMDILDQMGLVIEVEKNKDTLDIIHKLLGPNKNQAKQIFKVINKKTQEVFEKHVKKVSVKKKRLYWHGSRNENWFNVLQTGLLIRPSGAVHTGSMFGDGIYFADKAQKSIGYSSLSGSHWTRGNADKGFLALFDVHVGNQKEILHHDSSCYSLSEKVLKKDAYDSVFAKGGADLRNNEYVIYNSVQCTVSHLIEITN